MIPPPLLTIVVPIRPGQLPPLILSDLRQWKLGAVEIILAEGRATARQRNQAVREASAPVLYFLDDDSTVTPQTVRRGLALLASHPVAVVGGPAITRMQAGVLERCFGEVTASRFGVLRLRARSIPVGLTRPTDGEELIFCNLMMLKQWYQRVGGLDEQLYPGEDPDFWRRLRSHGAPMLYDPEMVVSRGRRRSLSSFALQQFRYGQGRGCRFFRGFGLTDLAFTVPAVFFLYLLLLATGKAPAFPLVLHCALSLVAGGRIATRTGAPRVGLCSSPVFAVLHAAYGAGFLVGLTGFSPPVRPGPPHLTIARYDGLL